MPGIVQSLPAWLDLEEVLARAGGPAKYRETVEDRIRQGEPETPCEHVKLGIALGTREFAKTIRARFKTGREMPEKRGLRKQVGFEDVVVMARLTGARLPGFCERHGDKLRDLVL